MVRPKWGELVSGTRYYPVHRFQKAILNSDARITLGSAGSGSGKTAVIPLYLAKQIEKNQGQGRYLVVAPTYKIFRQSMLLDSIKLAFEGTALQGHENKTENIYYCGCGAEIFFRSADTPSSLESGQYELLIIDEAAKISHQAWINAQSRVGQKQAPILLVSTPDTNNWLYDEVYKLADGVVEQFKGGSIRRSLDKSILVCQWASTVNPTYSKAEMERQRKILPDAIFRRRFLGEFAQLDGLVYPTFPQAILDENTPAILPSPAVRVSGGIDWGWQEECAVLIGVESQDGILRIVEEIYQSKMPLDVLAARLIELKNKWSVATYFCDHSRPEIRDQLRQHGLPCVLKKVTQVETGISMVDARIRSGFLQVYQNCHNLIAEAQQYARKPSKTEGEYSEQPIGVFDHAVSCLRYLVSGNDYGRVLHFGTEKTVIEDKTLATQIRLKQISSDPRVREAEIIAEKKRKYQVWFCKMLYDGIED